MKKSTKKILAIGGTTLMLGTVVVPQANAETKTHTDVIIRVGEYENKPGKRLDNVDKDFKIEVPVSEENGVYSVREYHLNKKLAKAIVSYLESQGVDVKLQDTYGKSSDLNSAGRKAKESSPLIYLSVHHNSYNETSSGYFFLVNQGDVQSSQYAKRLSNSMTSNPMLIRQMENRVNDNSRIGELNQRPGKVNILGEFGFFSNPDEVVKCASDKQIEYVSKAIGDELIKILNELK